MKVTGASDIEVVCYALDDTENNSNISCDGSNLLLTVLFLRQSLQGRNSDAEELHDDRRVDVRGDRQSEQSTVVERVTGHHYQVVQEGAALLNKIAALNEDVCERNRNSGADSEDKNNQSGEENLLSELLNLPCVDKSLEHFRLPLPFRPQPQS